MCYKKWREYRMCYKKWREYRMCYKKWREYRMCYKKWREYRMYYKKWREYLVCYKKWREYRMCYKKWREYRMCYKKWREYRMCYKKWREYRMCYKKWTILRNWQHKVHQTQDEDEKNTIRKQTQITSIRHEPSYKHLEVKPKWTSFLCGKRHGHHNTEHRTWRHKLCCIFFYIRLLKCVLNLYCMYIYSSTFICR